MMWTKENMFEPSGCFTREAFEALVTDQLPAEIKVLAEQHLESCPFCSDALEGFRILADESTFSSVMDRADEGFANIIARNQSKQGRKRTLWISVSAAASVLLLIGLFMVLKQPNSKMQFAQTVVKDTTRTIEKPLVKNTEKFIAPEKEKQKGSNHKAAPAEPVKNQVRFSPPVTAEEGVASEAVVQDELKDQAKSAALPPASAPSLSADKNKAGSEMEYKSEARSLKLKKVSNQQADEPVSFVETMPEYPGGEVAKLKFLQENIVYPPLALEKKISGRVYLQFKVEKDGKVSAIKVLRGIGGGCDEEAMRVVGLMPNWKPGTQNGKPVSVYFTLPIIFALPK